MGNKTPNGNIIVDAEGEYNRFDGGAHRHRFDGIKSHYAVGSEAKSKMLTSQEIRSLAPTFLTTLGSIVGVQGARAIDIISRKGRVLTAKQAKALVTWLNQPWTGH